jgi:hypothetical protein
MQGRGTDFPLGSAVIQVSSRACSHPASTALTSSNSAAIIPSLVSRLRMTPIPHQTCSDHVAEGHELISESMTVSKVLKKIAAPGATPELHPLLIPTGLMMNRQLMNAPN